MQNLRDMTEPELRAFLNSLGRALFVLVVFDDPGRGRHVSNANRADYIKAMRTTADRLERREDIRGHKAAAGVSRQATGRTGRGSR
jgi:hypothetical protein